MEQKTINPTEAIKAQLDYSIDILKTDKTWIYMKRNYDDSENFDFTKQSIIFATENKNNRPLPIVKV